MREGLSVVMCRRRRLGFLRLCFGKAKQAGLVVIVSVVFIVVFVVGRGWRFRMELIQRIALECGCTAWNVA